MHSCKIVILQFEIGGEENTFIFRSTVFEDIMLLKTSINVVTWLIYRKTRVLEAFVFYSQLYLIFMLLNDLEYL